MTLLQPKYERFALAGKLIALFLVLLLSGVLVLIRLYSGIVSARHEITKLRGELQQAQIDNAAMKDRMFSMLDNQSLEQVAAAEGLVKDNSPRFLQLSAWVVDSQ